MKIAPFNLYMIKKWTKKGVNFYCIGAGKKLELLCTEIPGFAKQIIQVFDNDKRLWGTHLEQEDVIIKIGNLQEYVPNNKHSIVLITSAYYEEIKTQLELLNQWRVFSKAYYYASREETHYYKYSWIYKMLKPQKKLLFRSGNYHYVPGWDYTDNAKALFDYLITNGFNKKYKMIWLVHNPEEHRDIEQIENTKVVSYEWSKEGTLLQKFIYFYHLRTSKYLFFTDAMFWTKYCGKDQIRVNLWHGNGFKAKKNKNGSALNPYFEFTTVSGPVYIDLHEKYLGCDRNKIFDTGLAKEDLLFMPLDKELCEVLDIPRGDKYIFWLPTFRITIKELNNLFEYEIESETGLPILNSMDRVNELNAFLNERNMVLVIKLHPVQEKSSIKKLDLSNIKVLNQEDIYSTGFQINRLLANVDALVSDFSSVAVDYMLREKPMAFVLEDEEQYKESRGFVFDPIEEYLPGKELYTFDDMKQFLDEVYNGIDSSKEKRKRLMPLMHSHNDGNNCKRILKAIGLE